MFLRRGSVIIEILPPELNHKGFRNLAGLMGRTYLSSHASEAPGTHSQDNNWQNEDVFLDKERFVYLLRVGVKMMYNKGLRNYDVN